MEMINPSGLINDAWHDTIAPVRRKLHLIIRESLGADADEMEVRFCEFCIFNQCSMLITRNRNELQYILGAPLDTALINRLTDHIANFSLAGIKGLVVNKR